jgi:hypothetical protein
VSAESGEGESIKTLQTEERMEECDSSGELGDMCVVAGGEVEIRTSRRAHKGRWEHTVRKSDAIGERSVRYICVRVYTALYIEKVADQ